MEQTLGKRIVTNRKRLGITQDALAEKLGVTAQAVSKWENDQSCPDITTLPRLAEIFGITIDELLGRDSSQTVYRAEVVDEERDGLHIEKNGMEFHWDGGRKNGLTLAILVLLVGILSFLSNTYQWDVSLWEILWPSSLLIFGMSGLFSKFSFWNLGCTLFGGYFLGSNLNIWRFSPDADIVFPVILVLFGLSLLFDAFRKPKKGRFTVKHKGTPDPEINCYENAGDATFDYSITFGSREQTVTIPRLAYGDATVRFGELVLDLSGCEEIVEDCRLNVSVSFGNLELLVPKKYRVKTDVHTVFGANEFTGNPDAQTNGDIYVSGNISFGNMEIRYI